MDMKEELQYWIEEFQDLDPEEVEELLEAILMDMDLEKATNFSDFLNPKEEEPELSVKDSVLRNVFSNLNKRKHFDIDD